MNPFDESIRLRCLWGYLVDAFVELKHTHMPQTALSSFLSIHLVSSACKDNQLAPQHMEIPMRRSFITHLLLRN